jgi:SAM-dependent methyltransferase
MASTRGAPPSNPFVEHVDRHRLGGRFGYQGLDFRCRSLFRDLGHVAGKSLLDIGGGAGLVSAWAVANGARRATNLEPDLDGSSGDARERIGLAAAVEAAFPGRLTQSGRTIQAYGFDDGPFDVIVAHNSINHLDEECCIELARSAAAQGAYVAILKRIRAALAPGGRMVVADAAPFNYWDRLRLRSPFAPTIAWRKHQEPELWRDLFKRAGFEAIRVRWLGYVPYRLRALRRMGANRFFARLTTSAFVITFRAAGDGSHGQAERSRAGAERPRKERGRCRT